MNIKIKNAILSYVHTQSRHQLPLPTDPSSGEDANRIDNACPLTPNGAIVSKTDNYTFLYDLTNIPRDAQIIIVKATLNQTGARIAYYSEKPTVENASSVCVKVFEEYAGTAASKVMIENQEIEFTEGAKWLAIPRLWGSSGNYVPIVSAVY